MRRPFAHALGSAVRAAAAAEGVSAVEFALVVPVLLVVLGGVVDVSRCLWYQSEVTQAVRSGTQYMTGNPTDYAGTAAVMASATNLGGSGFSADASTCYCAVVSNTPSPVWSPCSGFTCVASPIHRYVKVTASYTWTPIFGSLTPLPATVTTTTQLRVQ